MLKQSFNPMLAPGHVAFGVASYMGLSAFYGHQPGIFDYPAVFVGSLLPDIDCPESRVGKTFPTVSNFMVKTFGHRGITHSLLAAVAFMTFLLQSMESYGQATPSTVAVALCFGYLSHIWADFCTIKGVPLFWPYQRRDAKGKALGFRLPIFHFRTGGRFEYALTTALALPIAYNLVCQLKAFFFPLS